MSLVGFVVSSLVFLARWGPLLLLAGGIGWFLWDKNRVLVLAHDPETGKVWPRKARVKDDGLRVSVPGLPDKVCKPKVSMKGEWQGILRTRPVIEVNARTGNQMAALTVTDSRDHIERVYHQMHDTADLSPEQAQQGSPDLLALAEVAWPRVYCQAIDGEHAAQLNKTPLDKALKYLLVFLGVVGTAFLLYTISGAF